MWQWCQKCTLQSLFNLLQTRWWTFFTLCFKFARKLDENTAIVSLKSCASTIWPCSFLWNKVLIPKTKLNFFKHHCFANGAAHQVSPPPGHNLLFEETPFGSIQESSFDSLAQHGNTAILLCGNALKAHNQEMLCRLAVKYSWHPTLGHLPPMDWIQTPSSCLLDIPMHCSV